MSLVSLIYVSYATHLMSDQDLLDILDVARERNKKEGITGMLLYRQRFFIQVLEGEEKNVDKVYASISKDLRHGNIMLVQKAGVMARSFDEWSMGFRNLDQVNPDEHPGFSEFLTQNVPQDYFTEDLNRAKRLLLAFKEGRYF